MFTHLISVSWNLEQESYPGLPPLLVYNCDAKHMSTLPELIRPEVDSGFVGRSHIITVFSRSHALPLHGRYGPGCEVVLDVILQESNRH